MTFKFNSSLTLFLLIPALLFLKACSDDPASTDDADFMDPPEPPDLTVISIDDSYFQENNPDDPEDPDFMAYTAAQQSVISVAVGTGEITELPNMILIESNNHSFEYENGEWSWEFPFTIEENHQDTDIDVRLTVTESRVTGNNNWNIYISTDDPAIGPLDQHNIYFFSASAASESGNFLMDYPGSDIQTTIQGNWTQPSHNDISLHLVITQESHRIDEFDMNYSQSDTQFSLLVEDDLNPDTPILITWDTAAGIGSIDWQDNQLCWNDTLRTTEC